jgi:flavin-dependent dehydrogenase
MPMTEPEICVVGGGPAGTLLARRLAQLGHETLLVDRTTVVGRLGAEALAPSIHPILDSVHLRTVLDAAVFLREKRTLLRWGAGIIEEKSFDVPSMLIERTLFDKLLRESAREVGVILAAPASARSPRRQSSGGWIIPIATPDGLATIKTKFFVDARGAPRNTADNSAPRTVAISANWIRGARCFAETRIEAGCDEWYWGSPTPDNSYTATIFLDPNRVAGLTKDARTELYRSLLMKSKLLKDLTRRQMVRPVSVRDATCSLSNELIGNDFIRVGDAAVSIDPLSSQGIQAALLSAIQGGAVIHTLLAAGHDSLPAIEFYRGRQQRAAKQAAQNAARFYRTGAYRKGSSFWLRRSSLDDCVPSPVKGEPRSPIGLPVRTGLSPAVRIVDVPILSGSFITHAPALSHPSLDYPVAFLGGAALVPLINDATGASTASQILHRWTRRVPPEAALGILKWMFAVGILIPHAAVPQEQVV